MMSDALLETFTCQYEQAMPSQCLFAWQGGEPLLAGREFFARAVALQKQFARPGQTVSNAVQTNGTLLDDAWCEFFAAEKFLVGVSLDGPAQWHDRFRRDHAGNPTFHRAWAGLELLRKRRVEFNVLVTLNSANVSHAGDIYRYFVNRDVRYLQFIPILERRADGTPTEHSCTAEQFGRFMLDVFELWSARDVGRISERFIDDVLHTLIYGHASLCCYSARCANAFVLEYNGDLYACDHFVYPQWRIGNIAETPLAELAKAPLLDAFALLKTSLPEACRDCEFRPLCNGGCPKHHAPIGTENSRVNHFCEGYKMFFREALPELRRMAESIAQGRMPSRRTNPAPTAATGAPGRNDPCLCGSGLKYKNCCGRK
jgi:uncharacterized protein